MRLVDSKRIVAEGYDEVAHRYAELERAEARWPRMRWLAELLEHLPDDSDVLDVGCVEHLPREEHARLFARLAGWLRPGGYLLSRSSHTTNRAWSASGWARRCTSATSTRIRRYGSSAGSTSSGRRPRRSSKASARSTISGC